jgi:propanediol dehydratase small subunit
MRGMEFDPVADYPIGERRPDLVRAPDGTPLDEITLDAALAGDIDGAALGGAPETLARQAAVALAAGSDPLAANFVRASELTALGDETILEIYTALRPRRSTAEELGAWADRLEHDHDAPVTAAFVREAAAVYAARGLLRTAPGERAIVAP